MAIRARRRAGTIGVSRRTGRAGIRGKRNDSENLGIPAFIHDYHPGGETVANAKKRNRVHLRRNPVANVER